MLLSRLKGHARLLLTLIGSVYIGSLSVAQAAVGYPVIFEAERRAVLSAERDGVLVRLDVDTGKRVDKGATLASVDTGELALDKKRLELNRKFLSTQLENLVRLNARGLATDEEVAKTRTESAVTNTEIQIIRRQIAHSRIRAPFTSVVIQRLVQPHEWVTAGQPVVEIVDPGRLRVVGNIPVDLGLRIKIGDTHAVYVPDFGGDVKVVVKAITPAVDEQSNTVRIVWTVNTGNAGVLAGMKGELKLKP